MKKALSILCLLLFLFPYSASAEQEYSIHQRTIQEWVIQYEVNGESAFIQEEHNRVYSVETKLLAVADYLHGKGSQQEITAKYGLRPDDCQAGAQYGKI